MQALILNSGTGSRMGNPTKPKCLTKLNTSETILSRQLRQLCELGVRDVIITTGRYELQEYCKNLPLTFTFVNNPQYDRTNNIYSVYLARKHVNTDLILLHGDLVFDTYVLYQAINAKNSCMAISTTAPLPQKDFKAVLENGKITQIGVDYFDNAVMAQPLYKLNYKDWLTWLENIQLHCEKGETNIYAETALGNAEIFPLDFRNLLCQEIDTPEDLAIVNPKLERQKLLYGNALEKLLRDLNFERLFLVCGKSFETSLLAGIVEKFSVTKFMDFTPNPNFEDVKKAVSAFKESSAQAILAVGGGSPMDVAKCVKVFSNLQEDEFLQTDKYTAAIPLIAVPTTAGTGSESTRFAVIYKNAEKLSLASDCMLPDYAILMGELLATLPIYQKKCTFLDALCQALESWWSVNANEESIAYSKEAISLLMRSYQQYLSGDSTADTEILLGSNFAGRAINITQTTAPHALSYKLTTNYNLPHGHAVAICFPVIWQFMWEKEPKPIFQEIAEFMGYRTPQEAILGFKNLLKELDINAPTIATEAEIAQLAKSVNQERLKNSPVPLTAEMIQAIYKEI